jgi:hypothetical protein
LAQADVPPAAVAPAAAPAQTAASGTPADYIVLSREDHNDIVTTNDTPLTLTKAGRVEQALVRQALFISSQLMVTRPVNAPPTSTDSYRWQYEGFLQRQLCFTSMTGQFSCTVAELVPLPEVEKGEAPVLAIAGGADDDPFPSATAASDRLIQRLKARAPALFRTDKEQKVDPILKAAGVTATTPGQAAPTARR